MRGFKRGFKRWSMCENTGASNWIDGGAGHTQEPNAEWAQEEEEEEEGEEEEDVE
jgi:hypothetical protein